LIHASLLLQPKLVLLPGAITLCVSPAKFIATLSPHLLLATTPFITANRLSRRATKCAALVQDCSISRLNLTLLFKNASLFFVLPPTVPLTRLLRSQFCLAPLLICLTLLFKNPLLFAALALLGFPLAALL